MGNDVYVVIEHLRGEITDLSYTMLAAGRVLADSLGGGLSALLLGHDSKGLADTLGIADRVLYVDDPALADFNPDAYARTVSGVLQEQSPRVVLLGHTSMGMDLACEVANQLAAPIISSCSTVAAGDDAPTYTSVTCGGKLMAEGTLPDSTCLMTLIAGGYKPDKGRVEGTPIIEDVASPALDDLRTRLRGYIEPEAGDVDIASEEILISVGRGIQREDNLELVEELADAIGGTVSASRPVVDQGWLPTSRMVGKSGKIVKPKLYLALGISGAPEHAEGMSDAELIIAINTDEKAPIYDIADVGAAVDLLDLLPVLTEKVRQAKG